MKHVVIKSRLSFLEVKKLLWLIIPLKLILRMVEFEGIIVDSAESAGDLRYPVDAAFSARASRHGIAALLR